MLADVQILAPASVIFVSRVSTLILTYSSCFAVSAPLLVLELS